MSVGNTSPLSASEMIRLGAVWTEINKWVEHHSSGSWFTSKLLALWQTADPENRAKLAMGFPDECKVFEAWYNSEDLVPET